MNEWNDETAEWYASKYGEYATNRLAVDALDLVPGSVIVDVGCGTGSALRHASTRLSTATFIGIDPVPRMIEIARERSSGLSGGQRIELHVAAAEAVPLDDGIADVILAFDSFDHWHDRKRGLSEIRRVLRPEGVFVVVKDGGVPGGGQARVAFIEELKAAGFRVDSERQIEEEGVSFTMWTCSCLSHD